MNHLIVCPSLTNDMTRDGEKLKGKASSSSSPYSLEIKNRVSIKTRVSLSINVR